MIILLLWRRWKSEADRCRHGVQRRA